MPGGAGTPAGSKGLPGKGQNRCPGPGSPGPRQPGPPTPPRPPHHSGFPTPFGRPLGRAPRGGSSQTRSSVGPPQHPGHPGCELPRAHTPPRPGVRGSGARTHWGLSSPPLLARGGRLGAGSHGPPAHPKSASLAASGRERLLPPPPLARPHTSPDHLLSVLHVPTGPLLRGAAFTCTPAEAGWWPELTWFALSGGAPPLLLRAPSRGFPPPGLGLQPVARNVQVGRDGELPAAGRGGGRRRGCSCSRAGDRATRQASRPGALPTLLPWAGATHRAPQGPPHSPAPTSCPAAMPSEGKILGTEKGHIENRTQGPPSAGNRHAQTHVHTRAHTTAHEGQPAALADQGDDPSPTVQRTPPQGPAPNSCPQRRPRPGPRASGPSTT